MGGPDPQDPYWIGPCGPLDKQGQLNEGHDPRGEITRIDCLIMRLFMDLEKTCLVQSSVYTITLHNNERHYL